MINVFITNRQSSLRVSEQAISQIIHTTLKEEEKEFDEVSIYLVDTKEISELHARYFNDPSVTDCISFPMDKHNEKGYRMLGDVFVCPQTALNYCKKNSGDPYKELSLYIIHGILHLLGYNDIDDKDRKIMRFAEKRILTLLEKKNINVKKIANCLQKS